MRKQVDKQFRNMALALVEQKLKQILKQRDSGTFTSKHEILGIITEEYHELIDAVHNNNKDELIEELLDVAVGAVFGLACIIAETTEW